jgi:hypothetical protein
MRASCSGTVLAWPVLTMLVCFGTPSWIPSLRPKWWLRVSPSEDLSPAYRAPHLSDIVWPEHSSSKSEPASKPYIIQRLRAQQAAVALLRSGNHGAQCRNWGQEWLSPSSTSFRKKELSNAVTPRLCTRRIFASIWPGIISSPPSASLCEQTGLTYLRRVSSSDLFTNIWLCEVYRFCLSCLAWPCFRGKQAETACVKLRNSCERSKPGAYVT